MIGECANRLTTDGVPDYSGDLAQCINGGQRVGPAALGHVRLNAANALDDICRQTKEVPPPALVVDRSHDDRLVIRQSGHRYGHRTEERAVSAGLADFFDVDGAHALLQARRTRVGCRSLAEEVGLDTVLCPR